jgi:hypothetical protein
MLCAGGDFVRFGEPLSPVNRQTILRSTTRRWYTHIDEADGDSFERSYEDAFALRPHPLDDLRRARLSSPREPLRILRHWAGFASGRLRSRGVLVHDPFAVFSVDWFVRALGCSAVVVVRHPLAVVSSLKRLGWSFDFRDLLDQESLMRGRLEPYRAEMEAALRADVIDQGSLLWRIVYDGWGRGPDSAGSVHVVRHEDLSLDPELEFGRLYGSLGLEYDDRARAGIRESTSSGNPTEQSRDPDATRLDSRANLGNWRRRLADDEITRILESTRPVLERLYPDGVPGETLANEGHAG